MCTISDALRVLYCMSSGEPCVRLDCEDTIRIAKNLRQSVNVCPSFLTFCKDFKPAIDTRDLDYE